MPQRYQTQGGEEAHLIKSILGAYIYCTGCTRGWMALRGTSEQAASSHATSCRRKAQPRAGRHGLSSQVRKHGKA